MTLKLNRVTDDIIRENLEFDLARFDRMIKSPPIAPGVEASQRYNSGIGDTACRIGLMLYQQESPTESIRNYLCQAARFQLKGYLANYQPTPRMYCSPLAFEKALALTVCFADRLDRKLLINVERWKYCSGTIPDEDLIADFLDLLIGFLDNGETLVEKFAGLVEACTVETASRLLRLFILPRIEAFISIVESTSNSWNAAIAALLKEHEFEAKHGAYRRRDVGLICLPALMLAKLGTENSMQCTISSPYLPLFLCED